MFLFRRPTADQIKTFLGNSASLPLSYDPIGIARESPRGFKVDEAQAVIGHGRDTFENAKRALQSWKQFELGWVQLHPPAAPVQVGTIVAVVIHHLKFWSLNGCRVVYLIDEQPQVFGFAYGTLGNHAELGEEIFEVSFDEASGQVTYRIRAVSQARAAAAQIGYPYTRLLQDRFRRDSIAAMKRAVCQYPGTVATGS